MKSFSDDALDALERGDAIVGGAVAIMSDEPIGMFSGSGTIGIDGVFYKGIGARSFGQVTGSALGGSAQGITYTLPGIDPAAMDVLETSEVSRRPVVNHRIIWDSAGKTMLGAYVFTRGKVDGVSSSDVIGGEATIKLSVENSARGLGRRGGRMRSDADQRLIKANDGFFKNVSFAGEKQLYWGGKRPARAADALTSNAPGLGSVSGGINGTPGTLPDGRFLGGSGMRNG